ncbi:hypothetical protein OAI28_01990 [Methylophilaceae bacterium]|nr:hypothetical protein [Methylophilaceae bacterium]
MNIISKSKQFFLLTLFLSSYVAADVTSNKLNSVDSEISYELSDLDQIRDALAIYSRAEDKNNAIYEQKRRAMLDSVELRFLACDTDADDTLDVFEATQCLPQVARMFRDVDIDNDNLITLDEIAILAKTFERKNNQELNQNITASDKNKQDSAASLEKNFN